ncbi:transposase family protein [Streptomyces sp. B1866]|uniref:helix-turn-helix domain-containing protein n=1 Tax=Streptomyces sp. B1866 TaxID=3075431 RepID=UPI0028924B52|nr:transposase family protein [Streptomyces sp. B1866]MDT3399802.1 transposase family protein [Streptomyces sp. B1866]
MGAGAKHRLVFVDRLLATLVHLRHGAAHDVLACWFGVDRSTINGPSARCGPCLPSGGAPSVHELVSPRWPRPACEGRGRQGLTLLAAERHRVLSSVGGRGSRARCQAAGRSGCRCGRPGRSR